VQIFQTLETYQSRPGRSCPGYSRTSWRGHKLRSL